MTDLIPFLYYDKIENIDYNYLKSIGIKGLLIDLDNTLIATDVEIIPSEKISFLKELQKTFKVLIITNNTKTRMKIANQNNFMCVSEAKKPSKEGIIKALRLLDLDKSKCILIGDQLLSDIKGGNKIGMKTILVNPIKYEADSFFTKLQRIRESFLINKLKKKNIIIYNNYFKSFYESTRGNAKKDIK